ncbi:MAG: APC family permease, partial [Anaerolineaceae bacterium]|nr:APC family permease [Anaerolineaceae bacterium]
MNIDDQNGSTVIKRDANYKPPFSFSTWLIGRPLSSADASHETIGKIIGLAVFSSDALSSVAYAPQEMLAILVLAGTGALQYSVPLSLGIVVLLILLTLSYEQTIHAYPGGGGAYIVARDNLGEIPAQIAAGALLTDYILTVAVSISSGVAQLVSAFPAIFEYRVWIAAAMVLFIMLINLRGVRESGITFAIPTYFFVVMMYITVAVGLFRWVTGSLGLVVGPPQDMIHEVIQPISLFLILRAFSSGTTALTGVEAISNGIPAFKEPKSKNAGKTLIMMAVILGSLMFTITFLSHQIGALPSEEETVISQLARTIFGDRNFVYLATIASTTVILMMAANTSFADFPRLGALTANDGFLPRQLSLRGTRLVFSRGIMSLAGIAIVLIIIFQASVSRLIPLYAIGVFLSFTLSQTGMARRWWKSGHLEIGKTIKERGSTLQYEKSWIFKMVINSIGAFMTFVVMCVFAYTKFTDGAWVVIIIIPALVAIFSTIHHHYKTLAKKLSLDNYGSQTRVMRQKVIMPVGGVHRGTLAALRFARTITDDITAVHISTDMAESTKIQEKWETWGDGYRLVILDSPYRVFIEPLLQYIDEIEATKQPNEVIVIVVPQFVAR